MTLPTSISPSPIVDLSHHRIHEGRYFYVTAVATGLPAGIPKDFMIITPPPTISFAHTIAIISVTPGAIFQLFEDTVVSTNGTVLGVINADRNSPEPTTDLVFEDPTVVSTGLEIFTELIGSSTVGGIGGPLERDEDELIFKPLTNYLLRTTPLVNNTTLSIQMRAYRQATQQGT